MQLLILSCTNRPENLSIHLARHYEQLLSARGIATTLLDLQDLPLRILETDLYGNRSAEFLPIQQTIATAKRYLFVVPEYNGSIPGVFKLLIDATDYPESFKGKEAWAVGLAAGATGNKVGLSHLRDMMDYMGTEVYPEQLTGGLIRQKLSPEGNLTDSEFEAAITQHAEHIANSLKSQAKSAQ